MKLLVQSSTTLFLTVCVAACDVANESNELPATDNGSAAVDSIENSQVDTNVDTNVDTTLRNAPEQNGLVLPGGFTEGPAQTANNNGRQRANDGQQRNNSRSSQGIPDGGNERRNNIREQRRDAPTTRTLLIDNREIRSYDGTGNNVENPDWGSTFVQLRRLGDANYSDGVSSMLFTDRSDPRTISNTIVNQAPGENLFNAYGTSDMSWQWGQFIDHDIDLTDGSADEPANIPVPSGDAYFDPQGTGAAIIAFNRALYDPESGTDVSNPRQQENEISSWIDASMVYGSEKTRADALRVGPDSPFLKTSAGNLLPFNSDALVNANGPVRDPSTLFLAGDVRANEQVGLTAMHTLFVREHNRLATVLLNARPDANTNAVFETARRLVIAQIQKITYEEYLPGLVGPTAIAPYTGYNPSINPSIYNEFSAAAYRLGHSMVGDQVLRIGADGNPLQEGSLDLQNAFFNAPQLLQSENDIDPYLRGLAFQQHQRIDVKVVHTLRNLLFGRPGAGGLDLTALNIQRGRDHGLPNYNDARIAMGLEPVSAFSEIGVDASLQQSLQDAYGDVDKIDLWIGGLAEAPLSDQGSQLGELFHAIVVKQFTELRDGDRFWYQNDLNEEELSLIDNVTLARVIRRNTAIGNEIQDNVFRVR